MINWKVKSQNYGPIGLDIGHSCIRMIQLARTTGQKYVLAADSVRFDSQISDDPEKRKSFIISAIKQMMLNSGFRGKKVVSALPNDSLKITSLRLPELENSQIEQVLEKEVTQRFGFNPDKETINYIDAGSIRQGNENKNELILFVAENEVIKDHIMMLEQAHLRPVALDTVPC